MKLNIHAGHNPDGKVAHGAVGLIKESTEARNVKNELIRLLRDKGHTVHDCTVDNGISQMDVLERIVDKCNENDVDYDISIHLNAGGGRGCEAYVYDNQASGFAKGILDSIQKLGFVNRGVKINKNLYVLKQTKAKAILIECCFVDSVEDAELFKASEMAYAIATAIDPAIKRTQTATDKYYRVQVGAFVKKENAERLLADLSRAGFSGFITK